MSMDLKEIRGKNLTQVCGRVWVRDPNCPNSWFPFDFHNGNSTNPLGTKGGDRNTIHSSKGGAWTLVLIQIVPPHACCAMLSKSPHLSGFSCFTCKMRAIDQMMSKTPASCKVLPQACQFCLICREMYT